jgi:hypothetical protein
MSFRRVRAGEVYAYDPVLLDRYDRHTAHIEVGLFVRVVNLPGCPKANTMAHCHIEGAVTGEFLGLVHCNSLVPLTDEQRKTLRKQGTIRK